MNRLVFAALAGGLILSACASLPGAQANPEIARATFVQQTVEALPTLTLPAAKISAVQPTATATRAPTVTTTAHTSTPTATGTSPEVSASIGTETATATFTVTTTLGSITATASATGTPAAGWYGTQPPYVATGTVKLVNQSKAQVYVSFQCTTPEGYTVINEYPVGGSYFNARVAAGHCNYVAWVGGRKFDGSFRLDQFEELVMTFKKDSVTIR